MDEELRVQGYSEVCESRFWVLILACLIGWQCWLTLTLFGSDPVQALLDDRPIVSGAHPLHLYFGWLGASSLRSTGNLNCYDPAFQAGFPKTPIFDSGSRPAELFLSLSGGTFNPAAYKIGLAACCMLVPFLLAVCARGVGLSLAGTTLSVAFGMLVWWGDPCRNALEAGDLDLLVGGLCAVAFSGLLLAFDRTANFRVWCALLLVGAIGWLAHPFLFVLLLPLLLVYYLSVGTRHPFGWHVALFGVLMLAPGVNSFWLVPWMRSWWLRSPMQFDGSSLAHRTWQTFWDASCWGNPADRALTAIIFICATVGTVSMNQNRLRPTAPRPRTGCRRLGFVDAGGNGVVRARSVWDRPI